MRRQSWVGDAEAITRQLSLAQFMDAKLDLLRPP